ncbi:hypothetical protein SHI21_10375 [Bacteriovorax sp. PP10]|uniref:O-antigen polysaccharide polymerase Wzy n=1 Tax=Bacteriovorax antarcticus TaxID=3088717 RepID=A0ABU5VU89_9BACT|nr:hypothetical protein [Bacteriovorax sp. PP10]MEA9356613.1 hypothetical protein [Bacteriovorax sp. PP10]
MNLSLVALFRIIFLVFVAIIFCITLNAYVGKWYIYTIFTILINGFVLFGFREKKFFFETFLGIFIWLGYWLKFSCRVAFYEGSFVDPVGQFSFQGEAYDRALTVIICSVFALLLSSYVRDRLQFNYSNKKKSSNSQKIPIKTQYLKIGWILFFLLIVIITYTNFKFGIYQRGVPPRTLLPLGLNGVYTWLLLFGMASISSVFLNYEFKKNGKPSYIVFFLAIFETFLSSISMLSRGFVLNITALGLGTYEEAKNAKIQINIRKLILIFIGFLFAFCLSVFATNYIRSDVFHGPEESMVKWEASVLQKVQAVAKSTTVLFVDRWVGIEGVMAASSYDKLGWDLWKTAWKEKFYNTGTSFYDLTLIQTPYEATRVIDHHFITLPGFIAFFFYPGSYIFLFCSMLILYILGIVLEWLAYNLSGGNLILCSLLAQVWAYRYAHFGYVPKQTYLLFGSVLFNIFLVFIVINFIKKRKSILYDY